MLAGAVGDPLEVLGRRLAVRAVAAVEIVARIGPPPRNPRAESVVSAVRRRVARRRCRHDPVRFGVAESAAGVVLRLDAEHRVPFDEMRGFGFDLCLDLEFRSPEFLHLELMVMTVRSAGRAQFDRAGAEVHIVGQLELEIEGAEHIHFGRSLRDLVASRVAHDVRHAAARAVAERLYVAEFAAFVKPYVTLDRNLFLGTVHLAVVENEPRQRIGIRLLVPASVIAPIVLGVLGHERDVPAPFRDQDVCCLFGSSVRQRQSQDPVLAGLGTGRGKNGLGLGDVAVLIDRLDLF